MRQFEEGSGTLSIGTNVLTLLIIVKILISRPAHDCPEESGILSGVLYQLGLPD